MDQAARKARLPVWILLLSLGRRGAERIYRKSYFAVPMRMTRL